MMKAAAMLSTLRIKNLALVADLTLQLQPGYNVITGETGAGKSIIIGALNLLLGAVGLKFNPGGRLLISGNVLLSLSKDNGLQDMVTPTFQIDYNF